jgi:DNA-binding PadR family transcriptional regulator
VIVRTSLGINEALILACLCSGGDASVADIAERLEGDDFGRKIDDGSIYVALQRMAERGYVSARKTRVVSTDGRPRDIGIYRISDEGTLAMQKFQREAGAVNRLRIAFGGA